MSRCDPGWLQHRDVSTLKPTAECSSRSQSLLVLCPTPGWCDKEHRPGTAQVWWHKSPSRETWQALEFHAPVALQCPRSAPST